MLNGINSILLPKTQWSFLKFQFLLVKPQFSLAKTSILIENPWVFHQRRRHGRRVEAMDEDFVDEVMATGPAAPGR